MSDNKPHDASYRRLFAHKPMIEDLLRQFARGPWLERFDFDSLELVPTHHVAEGLEQRLEDMIWRLRYRSAPSQLESDEKCSWFYVYVLVEFQSTVDRFMALRMLVYVGLLYQHLVRQKDLTESRLLPPILPIVLYNGERSWSAPKQMADLVAEAEGLDSFRPHFKFLLLDEGRIPRSRLKSLESPVAAMFEIEQSRDPDELKKVVDKLCRVLAEDEMLEIRRDFGTWLKRLIVPARFAEFELTELKQLEEFRLMIEERVKEWTQQWKAEGYEQGIEAGRRDGMEIGRRDGMEIGRRDGMEIGRRDGMKTGRRDGMAKGLKAQMELKFGPLPAVWRHHLEAASFEQLESWNCQILTAESLDQMLDDPEP